MVSALWAMCFGLRWAWCSLTAAPDNVYVPTGPAAFVGTDGDDNSPTLLAGVVGVGLILLVSKLR
jgi:hypothetical protein